MVLSSHRTRLPRSSDRDDRSLPCLGRNSFQDRQRKQDSALLPPGTGSRILGLPIPERSRRVCSCCFSDGALLIKLHPCLWRDGYSVQPTVWPSNRWILDHFTTGLCNCNSNRRHSLPVRNCQLSLRLRGDLRLCGHSRGIVPATVQSGA